ncbi:SPOR domain-containing protein [Neisseria dentiae]|uniref:SPOR domain-containing protein n=1 Tax=Neisseria dentiae TaxID=194197 RepID=UPI0035A1A3BD
MSNNRFHSLNEYEKLKRKNRRRLVGASALVIFAGILLANVLNRGGGDEAAENISIEKAASAASETAPQVELANQAASSDDASDLSPAAVLEPAPADTETTELNNPLANPPAQTPAQSAPAEQTESESAAQTAAAAEKKAAEAKPTAKPVQAEAPKPQPKPQPKPEETAPPPVVVINNRVEPDAEAERKAAAKKAEAERLKRQAQQKAAAERLKQQEQQKAAAQQAQQENQARKAREQAAAKEAERQKAARLAEQEAGRLKAQKEARAKAEAEKRAAEAAKKKQQETNRKAAQDALNNKSAQASVEKSDPKTILEGKPASKKAIIQAGAYSNRDQAKQMQQKLADAGVSAYITEVETSKGKVYRVRTGHYPDRETAGKALERLRKKGADGIVIGQP